MDRDGLEEHSQVLEELKKELDIYQEKFAKLQTENTIIGLYKNALEHAINSLDTYSREGAPEDLEKLNSDLKQVLSRVDQLDIESSKDVQSTLQMVDVRAIVQSTVELVQASFLSRGIEIKFEREKELYVKANPEKLQKSILNLLLNAKEAVDSCSEKWISIRVVNDMKSAMLLVQDSGEGIASENKMKIFQSFYTSKSSPENKGLGLTLVKKYIEEMNGFVDVEIEEGEGACFVLKLELAEDQETKEMVSSESPSLSSGKVLLVHPKEEIASVLANSLSNQGFEVQTCLLASDVRETCLENNFDFVFVSYELDRMSGLQLISALREQVPSYLVLLFDKKIDSLPEKTKEAILKIAHGYLERPFDDKQFGQLMARVKSLNLRSA